MGYYRHSVSEKAANKLTEKQNTVLEARMELAPHTEFERDRVYGVAGVGAFEGTYEFKKSTITITPEGMKVEVEARMIFDGKPIKKTVAPTTQSPAPPAGATKTPADLKYTVRKGDSLSSIASKKCKSVSDWKKIEQANHQLLVSKNKKNANNKGAFIYVGMVLTIPAEILK